MVTMDILAMPPHARLSADLYVPMACENLQTRRWPLLPGQPTEAPTCDRPGQACFPWTSHVCKLSLSSVSLAPVKWSHSHPVCHLNDTLLLSLSPTLAMESEGGHLSTSGSSGAPGLDGSQVSSTSPSYAKASYKKSL